MTPMKRFLSHVALASLLCAALAILPSAARAGMRVDTTSWRVFLVGVNDYTSSIADLCYAESDVDALAERFRELGVARENITVLKGSNTDFYEAASSTAIKLRYQEFLESLDSNSIAFVFFSGQAFDVNGVYLAPSDFRLDRIAETSLSVDDMIDQLGASSAKFKLFCADIARTGLPSSHDELVVPEPIDRHASRADSSNLLAILGSRSAERAYEAPNLQHGIFTVALLDCMAAGDADGNRCVTVREMIDYLHRRVPELSRRFNRAEQHPDFWLGTNDYFQVRRIEEFRLFDGVKEFDLLAPPQAHEETEKDDEASEVEDVDATKEESSNDEASGEEANSDSEAVETSANSPRNWRALVIGIDRYDFDAVVNLDSCCNDAVGIAKALEKLGTPKDNITLLTSDEAGERAPTKENIEQALANLIAELNEESTAFVYFSGHGYSGREDEEKDKSLASETAWLVPQDAQRGGDEKVEVSSLIEFKTIISALSDAPGKFKWVVTDATYCAGDLFTDYPEVAVLGASERDSVCFVDKENRKHGLFTVATLEAFEEARTSIRLDPFAPRSDDDLDCDGTVTLGEFSEFVKRRTSKSAKEQFGVSQTPTFHFGKYGADYPIFRRPAIYLK